MLLEREIDGVGWKVIEEIPELGRWDLISVEISGELHSICVVDKKLTL